MFGRSGPDTAAPPASQDQFEKAFGVAYSLERGRLQDGTKQALFAGLSEIPLPDANALGTILTSAYMSDVFEPDRAGPFLRTVATSLDSLNDAHANAELWTSLWAKKLMQRLAPKLGILWLPYGAEDPDARLMFTYVRSSQVSRHNSEKIINLLSRYKAFGKPDRVETFELNAQAGEEPDSGWFRNLRIDGGNILTAAGCASSEKSLLRDIFKTPTVREFSSSSLAYQLEVALRHIPAYPREPASWSARVVVSPAR